MDGVAATIVLPVLGRYARTAPYDCPKAILEAGCAALADAWLRIPAGARPSSAATTRWPCSRAAIPLPAGGRAGRILRRLPDPDRREYHSWWYGPINILLAEYVLVAVTVRHAGPRASHHGDRAGPSRWILGPPLHPGLGTARGWHDEQGCSCSPWCSSAKPGSRIRVST